jgi:hypothetical protein
MSVDDDQHSGRSSTSTTPENIAKAREAIHDVCEIAGLSYRTVQRIWRTIEHETHFCEICAKTAKQ